MWPDDPKDPSEWRVLNYMPRRETCRFLDQGIKKEDLDCFCKKTASILRNLADRFDMLARGEITTIYYPNEK